MTGATREQPGPARAAPMDSRYLSLDALRGFAVMGILAMNIIGFAMPQSAYSNPESYGGTGSADISIWLFNFLLVDGKMRGLFSLLFGTSMMLVIERAESKNENSAIVHYSRMVWLALFGLFHFFFIWWGDILFLYAAIGSIAFLFRNWDADALIRLALKIYIAATVVWILLLGSLLLFQNAALAPGADPELVASYRDMVDNPGLFGPTPERELSVYLSSYGDIMAFRLERWSQPFWSIIAVGGETLPLMLFGMALLKNGFMLGEWDDEDYAKTATWLILIGLAITMLIAWAIVASSFDPLIVTNAAIAWTYPPRLMMTIGYAALLALLIGRYQHSGFIVRVAAAGRAAFTNYLATSIVMTTIFYGYGFGLFGQVGRIELYAFVAGAWALMLLWSKPWLAHFRYGPLEWLWRSLARGSVQPMRRESGGRI